MKNYNEYKEMKEKQETIVFDLSNKLNSFPKNELGMTVENIRRHDEFKAIQNLYSIEFKKLQDLNKLGSNLFKKELANERNEKRKLWRK